jgi:hypothetical protein
MNDLDLSSLATVPVPPLADASVVRARGEQRTRLTRASVAGAAALVVVASAGTAIALSSSGEPDSLQIANTPTPSTSTGRDPITWAAFPSIARMAELVPDQWLSGPLEEPDFPDEFDRCTQQTLRPDQRIGMAQRPMTTVDGRLGVDLLVEDYATSDEATRALAARLADVRRCPTVATDGPGAGSQDSASVRDSGPDHYTLDTVQTECQQDHALCSHTTLRSTTKRTGHLLLTVSTFSAERELSEAQLRSVAADFAQRAASSYGHPAVQEPTEETVSPTLGSSYIGAVVWSGDQTRDAAAHDEATAGTAAWGTAVDVPIACLQPTLDHTAPPEKTYHALVMLYDSPAGAERFVNGYRGPVEFVQRITLRCLS